MLNAPKFAKPHQNLLSDVLKILKKVNIAFLVEKVNINDETPNEDKITISVKKLKNNHSPGAAGLNAEDINECLRDYEKVLIIIIIIIMSPSCTPLFKPQDNHQ